MKTRAEGLVRGLYVLMVASSLQEVGRSGLYQLHPVHCFLIHHQMPGVTVIHPGSDKHMIPCGLILWEEGWNFPWVQMGASRKRTSFKPGDSSWLSQVSDEWTNISRLCIISLVFTSHFYCFYCEYFSIDCKGTIMDLACGRNHSHIWKTRIFLSLIYWLGIRCICYLYLVSYNPVSVRIYSDL